MNGVRRPTLVRGGTAHRSIKIIAVGLVAVVALWLPTYYEPYRVFQFSEVLIFAIAVLSLNLLTGFSGQISLGHSFFFAMGAYTTAILLRDFEVQYAFPILASFAVAFVLGFLFGIPALRLKGVYLALVTIALAIVAPPVIKRFESITGGSQGIQVDKPQAPAWMGLENDQWQYYLSLVVAVVVFVVARNLVRGRVGRALTGVRDNELAARTMGVNPATVKTMTFAYSAGFTGVAGSLYALVIGFVSPDSFTILLAINLLVGAIVGGVATIGGAVFGAAFIVFVPVYASDVNEALGGVIYGLALVAVMFTMRGGVMGVLHRIRSTVVTVEEPAPSPSEPTKRNEPAPVSARES